MKLLVIPVLFLTSYAIAQTPIQVSPIGFDVNNAFSKYSLDKMRIFDTSRLNNLDLTMESKKIPGLSVQHKSLSASSNLNQAQEYENRLNYGYSFSKSSTLSINAINQKTFGNLQEDNFLAFGFSKKTSNMVIDAKFYQLDNSKSNSNNTVASLTAKISL